MRRSAGCRLSTALLASLWLVSVVVGAIHTGTDRHTYCAAHRAFEETGGTSRRAPLTSGPTVEAAKPVAGHTACPFAEMVGPHAAQSLTPPPTCAAALPVNPVAVPYAPVATIPAPIAILHAAPKQSPPAA